MHCFQMSPQPLLEPELGASGTQLSPLQKGKNFLFSPFIVRAWQLHEKQLKPSEAFLFFSLGRNP